MPNQVRESTSESINDGVIANCSKILKYVLLLERQESYSKEIPED
jgi:hypothetical protein